MSEEHHSQGADTRGTSNHFGCLAEFSSVENLLAALTQLRERGYTRLEAYTPYPVEGLTNAIGRARDRIPLAMLIGGLVGALGAFAIQYYAAVFDYPLDIGGRPDDSWPAFIPAALEMSILFAAVAGVATMLISNGLPRLHHPLFEARRFAAATRDGLFVVVLAKDPLYDAHRIRRDLDQMAAVSVETVML